LRNSGIGAITDSLHLDNGNEVLAAFLARDDLIPAYCIYINDTEPKAGKLRDIVSSAGWYLEEKFPNNISLWKQENFSEIVNSLDTAPIGRQRSSYAWGILPVMFLSGAIITSAISAVRDTRNQ
jgi:hypothetical protein